MAENFNENFDDYLTAVLAREIQDFDAFVSCAQLSAGASQETYTGELRELHSKTRAPHKRIESG